MWANIIIIIILVIKCLISWYGLNEWMSGWPINGIMGNLMVIQYKRGYGPQYTVHGKTLFSTSEENLRHKGTVEEEPNQPPLTLF